MNEILRLDNVSLNINKKKIFNLSFQINKGDFFLVKGDNAVGKSLLLKLLFLKVMPSSGSIYLLGKKINRENKADILSYRKRTGVILQNDYLIPFFSVYQNIEIASEIQSKKENFKKKIIELIEWFNLNNIENKIVNNLSNGEKQRVVIARALINNPKIVIADYPENSLDSSTTKKLFFLLESLNKLGATVIMTSKNPEMISTNYKSIVLGE
jgi:ABC-type ATPase involved in cell division